MLRWSAALGSLLLASCAASPSTEPGWKRIDLEPFSLALPEDLKPVPVRPIDSYIGEFASPTLTVGFDYGEWSDPLTSDYGAVIRRESVTIGGRSALIVVWRRPPEKHSTFLACVHFPARAEGRAKLTISVESQEEASVATARKIFDSVRFAKH